MHCSHPDMSLGLDMHKGAHLWMTASASSADDSLMGHISLLRVPQGSFNLAAAFSASVEACGSGKAETPSKNKEIIAYLFYVKVVSNKEQS